MKTPNVLTIVALAVLLGCRTPARENRPLASDRPQVQAIKTSASSHTTHRPVTVAACSAVERLPPVESTSNDPSFRDHAAVQLVAYEVQPSQDEQHVIPKVEELPTPASTENLTLHKLEQMALSSNPAIAQAQGRIQALQGKWRQVGLYPNPTAGYAAEEVGDDGTAGKQGTYVSQQFILGKKLHLNRTVVQQELAQAEADFAAIQQRVRTDVQIAYYQLLLAQRRESIVADLVAIAEKAVQASQNLLKAEEVGKPAVLQSQIELNTSRILLQQAKNARSAAWRQLTSVIGRPDWPMQTVAGGVEGLPPDYKFDVITQSLLGTSPELASAHAATERARWALARAKVEAIPDIRTQIVVQHDNATGDDIAGIQVGIPLPIFDRNQGGVEQAVGQIVEAERSIVKTELRLRNELALVYQTYADARIRVEKYSREILPQAKESLELIETGYDAGELDFLSLLTAQRTYSQTSLAYLDALRQLWTRAAEIEGLLLKGSLDTRE